MHTKNFSPAEIRYLKKKYPPGTRIKLNSTDDPYSPVPPRTEGTVTAVDDMGTIHVRWDNGRTLGLIPGVDSFVVRQKAAPVRKAGDAR